MVSDEEIKLIRKKVCRMFKVGESDIEKIIVLKKSIDARKKHNLCLIYNVDVLLKNERKTTETNNPFEPMAEGIVPGGIRLLPGVEHMVAVRVEAVDAVHARIIQPSDIGLHDSSFPVRAGPQIMIHNHYTRLATFAKGRGEG